MTQPSLSGSPYCLPCIPGRNLESPPGRNNKSFKKKPVPHSCRSSYEQKGGLMEQNLQQPNINLKTAPTPFLVSVGQSRQMILYSTLFPLHRSRWWCSDRVEHKQHYDNPSSWNRLTKQGADFPSSTQQKQVVVLWYPTWGSASWGPESPIWRQQDLASQRKEVWVTIHFTARP